jgi:hypothetical protein
VVVVVVDEVVVVVTASVSLAYMAASSWLAKQRLSKAEEWE